jgi:hypothetical protein
MVKLAKRKNVLLLKSNVKVLHSIYFDIRRLIPDAKISGQILLNQYLIVIFFWFINRGYQFFIMQLTNSLIQQLLWAYQYGAL